MIDREDWVIKEGNYAVARVIARNQLEDEGKLKNLNGENAESLIEARVVTIVAAGDPGNTKK